MRHRIIGLTIGLLVVNTYLKGVNIFVFEIHSFLKNMYMNPKLSKIMVILDINIELRGETSQNIL